MSFSTTFKDIFMGNITFVLRVFKGSDLFLHFNVDVVTFVVRELAKSAMSVFVQRNSSNSYVFLVFLFVVAVRMVRLLLDHKDT